MPDPARWLEAFVVTAAASAIVVLAVGWRRPASATWLGGGCVAGMGLGLVLGYAILQFKLAWPPATGLDRLLTIVLPATLAVESVAGFEKAPRWLGWLLRLILAAATGTILLHGSIYLKGANLEGPAWPTIIALGLCGALLVAMWWLLGRLYQRRAGVSVALALSLAIAFAGITVMLAGYVRGGEAAFPPAAAVAATAVASAWTAKHPAAKSAVGIGAVALFGLLFIGRWFGGLSTGRGVIVFLAPLLCWTTELPVLRRQKHWISAALGLLLVAIPLVFVLAMAKRDFDREMLPMLGP